MIPSLVLIASHGTDRKAQEMLAVILNLMKRSKLRVPYDQYFGMTDQAMQTEFGPTPEFFDTFPVRRLVPKPPPPSVVSDFLTMIEPGELVPGMRSLPDALAVKAGLFLVNDYLDAAHATAQAADDAGPNTTAAYWHGIMHRREPDYDNARYWLRRVGAHPVFSVIGSHVAPIYDHAEFKAILSFDRLVDSRGHWDAMAFIDLCEECGSVWSRRAQVAAVLQEVEMRRLLEFTCRAAQGNP
jgi:hypothetical protein